MTLAWPKLEIEHAELGPTEFKSLGLELLRNEFKDGRKYHILDLGNAQGPNVEFFSQVPSRIHVEDLYHSWAHLPPRSEDANAFSAQELEALLTHDRATRFDIIMGWDLFDYFDADFIAVLTAHLRRHCRKGALLFMLTSTRREIPLTPARLIISNDEMLHYTPRSPETMDNPNHTPLAFEKMMNGFHLLHSFMLKNGMQEYVFTSTGT